MACKICGSELHIYLKDLYDDRYGSPGYHDIYCCSSCGFGRTIPGLTKNKIGKFYSKYYPLMSINPTSIKKSVHIPSKTRLWFSGNDNTAHFHINPSSTVLDIGSGTGLALIEIARLGCKAYGVEPDPNAQRLAQKLNLKVYQGFITDNPFPELKFDFITASQVLEHDPSPKKFLVSAKKKLKKNGMIILGVPNVDSLYRKIFGRRWLHWHVPYHLNFFTQKSITILAKSAGLKIVEIRTITPNLWTILQLRMLFPVSREGKPNPIWVSNQSKKKGNKNLSSIMKNLLMILLPIGNIGVMVMNRIVDILGLGESFLVILEREG